MATFDDFNFGDDAPTVDTDPTPDNDNLDANQSSEVDGIQDDTLNFPEPGQSDIFSGGEPSIWDVQGNPNEPGAQQDSIPAVSNVRQMFDIYNQLPDTSANVREMFDTYNYLVKEQIDRARHAEQDAGFDRLNPDVYASPREMFDAYSNLPGFVAPVQDLDERLSQNTSLGNMVRRLLGADEPRNPGDATVREMLDAYEGLTGYQAPIQNLDERLSQTQTAAKAIRSLLGGDANQSIRTLIDFQDAFYRGNADLERPLDQYKAYVSKHYSVFPEIRALLGIADSQPGVVEDYPLNAKDIALIQTILDGEDELIDRIFGVDELANSIDNPSGIGELFDKTIISGFDSWVSSPYEEIDGLEPNDFLSLANFDGLELADYIGDIYINSDIVEFQNMDDTALENWDGLL